MSLTLLVALQTAAAPADPAAVVLTPVDFDLARVRPLDPDASATRDRGCVNPDPSSILVCGRRAPAPAYPIERWERLFAVDPIRAETRIAGDLVGSLNVDQVALDRGAVSNRVMIRLRLPF